jgi:hypothetical protein
MTDATSITVIAGLMQLLDHDPWSLTLAERRQLKREFADADRAWRDRIVDLTEPPAIGPEFPAFLLDTPAFRGLHARIGDATAAAQLDMATADELQRFVDRYRAYLFSGQ